MIIFEWVEWRNFLSTGNNPIKVDLKSNKSTLIVGTNGVGKSTMVDALSFVLFGKPHRKINIPQLTNSINKKNCCVEVQFSIGSNVFRVKRGLNPGIFEIYKNENMISQNSNKKEYQTILEKNILKLNHRSFHQIVVLGSSSFVPFMELPAQARRDVIEDLLDINIFSKMNVILKEKMNTIKADIKHLDYELSLFKEKAKIQDSYIKNMKMIAEDNTEKNLSKINDMQKEIVTYESENKNLNDWISEHKENSEKLFLKYNKEKQSLVQQKAEFKGEIKRLVKDSKFYEDNDNCPTCEQVIDIKLKDIKLKDIKTRAKELNDIITNIDKSMNELEKNILDNDKIIDKVRKNISTVDSNDKNIKRLLNEIGKIEDEMNDSNSDSVNIEPIINELDELNTKIEEKSKIKMYNKEQLLYNIAQAEMLKDSGIKTKIIKEYVPVINRCVNEYLQVLDFFVHFNLTDSFQEEIRSRHRDTFSYGSFSEGQKQRIDLALLFTWRQIAKMKNSAATNLLVLDETFDSSLDDEGVNNVLKILGTLGDNTNTFIISHKGDILNDKFKNKIEFKLNKNFSEAIMT